MGYIESRKKKTRSPVTAVMTMWGTTSMQLQDNAEASCGSCCFPLRSIKYGLWQVLYLPPSSQNHRLSAGAPDCTAPIDPLLRLSNNPLFELFDACRLPSLGHRLWCHRSLFTKSGRSPWGSIHAFSQWDDKMPFLSKLHSLQLKEGIEGKEQNFWKQLWISLLGVHLLTLVGAPCRECRYSIWRLLPHSHLKRCLR